FIAIMEYAKALVPSFSWLALPAAQPRPFKMTTYDRCQRIGLMASSLEDLLSKTKDSLFLTCPLLTVVLEEDGTLVESEDFFCSLPNNTQFMVLEKGQEWAPVQVGDFKLTFDLYKLHPKDFIGCLNIKARLYGMYTVSYDIECMGAKHFMVEFAELLGSFIAFMCCPVSCADIPVLGVFG
uniref:CIDE-N domain-containing protein n=1 Tax=Scleropages formosus TaxID=113540 RepID=A0A8C9TBK8_SCLFO